MLSHISKADYSQTGTSENVTYPSSVDTHCPRCKKRVNFRITWKYGINKVSMYTMSSCPACRENSTLIYVINYNPNAHINEGELFIYPKNDIRALISGIEHNDKISAELKAAYKSTVDVFNAQVWPATAVLCRRVLEGICQSVLPPEQKSKALFTQLQLLPGHIDLQQPILTLADSLRIGGNLGAHFITEKEPNKEISKLMIDLLDYLIEYIYILPSRIQELHNEIDQLKKEELDTQI